jgi:hypothetical protein
MVRHTIYNYWVSLRAWVEPQPRISPELSTHLLLDKGPLGSNRVGTGQLLGDIAVTFLGNGYGLR